MTVSSEDPAAFRGAAQTGDALWAFSLSFYGRTSVSAHCVALQDTAGADANLILLLLYAATRGTALGVEQVARLDRSCSQWRDSVIRPLRGARRAVKASGGPESAGVYPALRAAELAAEKAAQYGLARELDALSAAADVRPPPAIATANLDAYRRLVPMPDAPIRGLLAAFSEFMQEQGGKDR